MLSGAAAISDGRLPHVDSMSISKTKNKKPAPFGGTSKREYKGTNVLRNISRILATVLNNASYVIHNPRVVAGVNKDLARLAAKQERAGCTKVLFPTASAFSNLRRQSAYLRQLDNRCAGVGI